MIHYDVIVIGGGASGMMTAGIAAQNGRRVLILEKNATIGEKLKISGGGRCNITNAEPDLRKLLSQYGENDKFLHAPFSQFSNLDTFRFFESLALPLVVQEWGRAFPNTEQATDVAIALETYLKYYKVTIHTQSPVTRIMTQDQIITGVIADGKTYTADAYILATGGLSHPETGSTGDGFRWLKDLGHTVIDPTPSIVPVAVLNKWIKSLSGKSFDNVKITFFVDRKKAFGITGRILATHFGLSGPTILNASKKIGDLMHEGLVTAEINLFPTQDLGAVERLIINLFDTHKNKSFKNVFPELVPQGMSSSIIDLVKDIDPDMKCHSITKDQRKSLVRLVTGLPVTITGLMGFDRAVIADGGIPLSEIDTRTMRSLKVSNLYITGDLLHVNRPSGGYSLQLCWTTGYVAGKNV